MPSSKKNITPDLNALLTGLNNAEVEFIIVGGMAAVAQGAPITTFDLDIVHRRTDKNAERLLQFLSSIDAAFRRPDDKIRKPDIKDLQAKGHVLLATALGPLDLLAHIEEGLGFDELIPDCIEVEFQAGKLLLLDLEKIVLLKRQSLRPEDKYRLPILEETLRQRNRKS